MKVLVLCCFVALLAGAQAQGFVSTLQSTVAGLKDKVSSLFSSLKAPLNQLLASLTATLKQEGTKIIATGAASLLGSLGSSATAAPATRRNVEEISNFLQEAETFIHGQVDHLKLLAHAAVADLEKVIPELFEAITEGKGLEGVFKKIEETVSLHSLLQNHLLQNLGSGLLQAAEKTIGHLVGLKRSGLTDTIASVSQSVAALFKPVSDAVTQHVSSLGSTLKGLGTSLLGSLAGTFAQLKTELSTHISSLKDVGTQLLQHGTNALSALKSAASDVLAQTFQNAQPAVQKAVSTLTDAAGVVASHLG